MSFYKPRKGSKYWMINSRFEVKQTEHTGSEKSRKRIAVGNVFKTEKEAKHFRAVVMGQARSVSEGRYIYMYKPFRLMVGTAIFEKTDNYRYLTVWQTLKYMLTGKLKEAKK